MSFSPHLERRRFAHRRPIVASVWQMDDGARARTQLSDLPPDILCMIGTFVASPDRDVALISKDAAACTMTGAGPLVRIGSAAWVECARIAETIGTVRAYRRSWGAERPDACLLKREIARLARAIPWIRSTTPAWEMNLALESETKLGEWCPIPRVCAMFILELTTTYVSMDPHPPAFRDRDLSACPTHVRPMVVGKRLIRLRDALQAPVIDRASIIRQTVAANRELDQRFRSADVRRHWHEQNLALRLLRDEAHAWTRSVRAPYEIAHAVLALTKTCTSIDFEAFTRVVLAYRCAEVSPTASFMYAHQSLIQNPVNHARGDIFGKLQIKRFGSVIFSLASDVMPTLETSEISDTISELFVHQIVSHEIASLAKDHADLYEQLSIDLLDARTLADANRVLDNYAALLCDDDDGDANV